MNHSPGTREDLESTLPLADPMVRRLWQEHQQIQQVASELRNLRRRKKVSQAVLAERVGSTQPAIARFEAGRVPRAGYVFVRRLFDALEDPCR